jgi:hypothetical protein
VSGSSANLSLQVNADATAGNYGLENINAAGSALNATRSASHVFASLAAGVNATLKITMTRDVDGNPRAHISMNRGASATIEEVLVTFMRNNVANVTAVQLVSSVASSLTGSMKCFKITSLNNSGRGTAFPGSPIADQRFWRTDLDMEFYYDGTRWLSTQLFTKEMRWTHTSLSTAATIVDLLRAGAPGLQGGTDIWMESLHQKFSIASGGSALGAAHKWVGDFHKYDATPTATTLVTMTIDSGASGTIRTSETAINALLGTGVWFSTTWTKTGTPGSLQSYEELTYRITAN